MKKLSVILGGVLLVFAWHSLCIAGQGAGGNQQGSAQSQISQEAQAAPPATVEPKIQPRDKNGKPMSAEEFAKAEQARMKARTAATQRRLEARQARWKKAQNESAEPLPVARKTAEVKGPLEQTGGAVTSSK